MAYKTHEATKRLLNKKFLEVCNGYLLELCNMWELNAKEYGYWVGDEVGGTWAYGDSLYINIDDIIFCVENNVSYNQYMEWQEYCEWAVQFRQTVPRLKSWMQGCPRVDKDSMEKLNKLKNDLDDLIRETSEKY